MSKPLPCQTAQLKSCTKNNSFFQFSKLKAEKLCSSVFFTLVMLLFSATTNAQTITGALPDVYTFASLSGTYTAITGGTVLQSGTSINTDAVTTTPIPIGFSFTFNGTAYTTVNISNNGFITFGTTAPTAGTYNPIAATTGYAGAVSGYGIDLIASTVSGASAEIRYQNVGSDFIVQFKDLARNSVGATVDRLNFQIHLTQTTNVISIVYGTVTSTLTNASMTAAQCGVTGIRGAANISFMDRMVVATAVSSAYNGWATSGGAADNGSTPNLSAGTTSGAPGANVMRYNTAYIPTSGLTYTWTPIASSVYQSVTSGTAYTQNFETWSNSNAVKDVPGTGVITFPSTGNASWRNYNESTTNSLWSSTNGRPTLGTSQGTGAASFYNYGAAAGTIGYMDILLNFSAAGAKYLSFDLINGDPGTLKVYLSTDGGATFGSALATYNTALTSWTTQTPVSLGSSISSTCVLRFEATGTDQLNNIGVDNVSVSILPACTAPVLPAQTILFGAVTSTSIGASTFTPSASANGYLVIQSTGTVPSPPQPGVTYSALNITNLGATGLTFIQTGSATTFTPPTLIANTAYTYYVYAYNSTTCANGPIYLTSSVLSASKTTCAGTPAINTPNPVTTSAFTLNWSAPSGGSAGTYTYTVDVSLTSGSFGAGNDITGFPTTTTANTLLVNSSISSGTTYYYQITASNGICSGASAPSSVTTVCGSNPIPFSQNFDAGVTVPNMPNCWQVFDANNDGTTWTTSSASGATGYSPANVLRYSYNTSNTANDWASTPGLSLTGGVTYQLSYIYAANYTTNPIYTEKLEIRYTTSATALTAAILAAGTPLLATTSYTDVSAFAPNSILFTPATNGTYYIGFHCTSAANQGYLDIDNVNVVSAYVTAQPGDWNNTATWTGNVVPPANSVVIINHAVTAAASILSQAQVTINSSLALTQPYTNPSGSTVTVATNGTFAIGAAYTNTGTTTVNGTFQLNTTTATVTGSNLTYGSAGTLAFNAATTFSVPSSALGLLYWPTTSGPFNVSVLQGGLNLGSTSIASRTVLGTFQTAAAVALSNSSVLTIGNTTSGTCQLNSGGSFSNSPTYASGSTLIYNLGTFPSGSEWNATAAAAGAGVPQNVTIQGGAAVTMSNVIHGLAGNLNVSNGTLTLGSTSGADLNIYGNWTIASATSFVPAGRTVNFVGAAVQTITGATNFAGLTLNSTYAIAPQIILGTNSNISVSGLLTFTKGVMQLNANNVTLGTGASTSIAFSSASFLQTNSTGVLTMTPPLGTATIFPVGSSSGRYAPLQITTSGIANSISVGVSNTITNTVAQSTKIVILQWSVLSGGSGTNALISYIWNSGDQAASFSNTSAVDLGNYTTAYAVTHLGVPTNISGNFYGITASSAVTLPTSGTNLYVLGNLNAIATAPCTVPVSPTQTNLGFTQTTSSITATFNAWTGADNYLVIRTTSSIEPTPPTNGTTYTAGTLALGGYVVSTAATTGFTDNTISPSTTYWYWIYPYSSLNCSGGPLYTRSILLPTGNFLNGSDNTSACSSTATNTLTIPAGGLTANWSTASNWSLNHVPTSCENAVITWSTSTGSSITSTITIDVPVDVYSLTITGNWSNTVRTYTLAVVQSGTNAINITNGLTISATGGRVTTNAGAIASQAYLVSDANVSISGPTNIGLTGTNLSSIGPNVSTSSPNFTFYGNVTLGSSSSVFAPTSALATYYFDASGAQQLNCLTPTFYVAGFTNMVVGYNNTPTLTMGGNSTYGAYIYGGNLNIKSGATFVVPQFDGIGQYTAGSGTFTIGNNAILQVGDQAGPTQLSNIVAGSNFPGGFGTYNLNAGSTVIYNSGNAVPQTVYAPASAPFVTYGNLILTNSTGSGSSIKSLVASTSIAGNLTVNGFATFDISTFNANRTAAGGTLSLAANGILRLAGTTLGASTNNNFPSGFATSLDAASTTEYYGATQTLYSLPTYGNLTITTSGIKTAAGALTIAGNMLINSGATLTSGASLLHTVGGNWLNSGGTFTPSTSTVTFNGAKAQSITGSASPVVASQTFNNITTANSGTALSVSGSTTTLNLNALTIGTGTSFAAGTATNINVAGDWTDNGTVATGNFLPGSAVTNTVTFNGGIAQKITGNSVNSQTFNSIATSGNTVLSVNAGSAITSLTMAGSVTIGSGSTFAPGANIGSISVAGDWKNSGTYTTAAETVTFNGTALQNIGPASTASPAGHVTTFNNLEIKNTASSIVNNAVLLGIGTKATSLKLTSGVIDVSSYPLELTTPVITGTPSATSFVLTGNGSGTGVLQADNVTTSGFTFPIGVLKSDNTRHYMPATVTPVTAGLNWTGKVFTPLTTNGQYPAGSSNSYGTSALAGVVNTVWDITPSNTSTTATLKLVWDAVFEGSSFSGGSTPANHYVDSYIGISHYTSSAWQGATATGGASYSGKTVTSTFTSFSPFAIGAINDPLASKLTDFNAALNNNKTVGLTWTTQQELNSSHFEVERSADGIKWEKIGTVRAKGSSAIASDYSYTDASPLITNYYRIRMVSLNGDYSYTTLRVIKLLQVKGIIIFPNPARNYVNVSVSESAVDLNVKLISPLGQVMQVLQVKAGTGTTLTLDVHNFAQGTYILQVTGSDGTYQTSKVLIMR